MSITPVKLLPEFITAGGDCQIGSAAKGWRYNKRYIVEQIGLTMQATWNRIKSVATKREFAGWALIAVGVILRMREYLVDRSFWHDEANLALNLVNRNFAGLTQPLDYDQGAPVGFLFIEKLLMIVLGNKDYLLRLFPLFSGLLAIYLIYRVSSEYFRAGWLFAVLLFVISWPLIYYSSELKQYSSDAMFALLLIYLALCCLAETAHLRDFLLLGAAGFISIWISHPSALILAGIGLVLFFENLFRKRYTALLWTLGMGALWVVSFGWTYLVSLQYLVSDQSLQNYWRNGFMPFPPWNNWNWFARTYLSLMVTVSPGFDTWYLTWGCSLLIVFGAVLLYFRERYIALVIILPFLMASIASILQKYPLRGRFLLFLVPLLILLMAECIGRIYTLIGQWNRGFAFAASAVVGLMLLWFPVGGAYNNFLSPPMGDDIKPVMEYIDQHKAPNDVIYVYHGARPSFNYYAPFYNFDSGSIITGTDLPDVPALKQFYKQVDQLKGDGGVWFLFSHIVDCGGCDGDMETFYTQYLDQFGSVEDEFHAPGASVYLYDLNSK